MSVMRTAPSSPVSSAPGIEQFLRQAAQHLEGGDSASAASCLVRALDLEPESLPLQLELARALVSAGQAATALRLLESTVRLHPAAVQGWVALAEVLQQLQQIDTSLQCLHVALSLDPGHALAIGLHAQAHSHLGHNSEAMSGWRRLLEIEPENVVALANLASLLRAAGDHAAAVSLLRTARDLQPHLPALSYNLANVLAELGEFPAAREQYQSALENHPQPAKVLYNLSTIMRFQEQDRPALEEWSARAQATARTDEDQVHLSFALGKAHDDLGEYAAAFARYRAGNELVRTDFDPEAHSRDISEIIRAWPAAAFRHPEDSELPAARPVFIIGMPRSGTTLVEQLLARHTSINPRGELAALAAVTGGAADAGSENLPQLARQYLELAGADEGAATFSDKLPANFLRLGWIARLFPGAVILHCRRDPRDVCLSCYFQHFTRRLPYAYRLDHLVAYFQEYRQLMAHWHRVLPLAIYDVPYEEVVRAPEEWSRQLARWCDLDWRPEGTASEKEHSHPSRITTASHWQARQQVHTRSTRRWEHYREFIPELLAAFGDS